MNANRTPPRIAIARLALGLLAGPSRDYSLSGSARTVPDADQRPRKRIPEDSHGWRPLNRSPVYSCSCSVSARICFLFCVGNTAAALASQAQTQIRYLVFIPDIIRPLDGPHVPAASTNASSSPVDESGPLAKHTPAVAIRKVADKTPVASRFIAHLPPHGRNQRARSRTMKIRTAGGGLFA